MAEMKKNDYLCGENLTTKTMRIKEKIKERGLTISSLAEKLGTTQANVSKQIINAEKNLSITFLRNIARELGISVSELIDDPLWKPDEIQISLGGEPITYIKKEEE